MIFVGKLRYDRHWAERDVSKERVLKEVTDIKEANLVSDVTCNEPDKREDNARSPTIPATSVSNSGGTVGRRSRRDPLVVISPLNRSGLDKSTLQSPVIRSPVTPVSVTIKRSEERDDGRQKGAKRAERREKGEMIRGKVEGSREKQDGRREKREEI